MNTNSNLNESMGFSPIMALCLAAITLVGVDGEFKEDELNKLRTLLKADETSFLKAFNFYNQHSLEICIKMISTKLNDEQKRATYKILLSLAKVDREIAGQEKQLLAQYASAFGLKDDYIASVKQSNSKDFNISAFN